jgi:hypothetical protein
MTKLIPVCRLCGLALVAKGEALVCPSHGEQARWSYAVKGKDK